jgi:hypothetical protein
MTRAPATGFQRPAIDETLISEFLRKHDELQKRLMMGAIAGGVVICMISTLIITVIYMILANDTSFMLTYIVIGIVTLPISFAIAHYLKGSILEATVPDSAFMESRMGARMVGPALVVAEIANFGPRLVLYGIKTLQNHHWIGQPQPARIAAAVAVMVTADAAVTPVKLLLSGETADQLEPVMAFLLYHELVDMSKTGDRLWLTTEGKRKLGLTPAPPV